MGAVDGISQTRSIVELAKKLDQNPGAKERNEIMTQINKLMTARTTQSSINMAKPRNANWTS